MIRNDLGQFTGTTYKKIGGEWYRKQCLDCGAWLKGIYAKRCKKCNSKMQNKTPKMQSGYSYSGVHVWLLRNYGKATECQNKKCDNKSIVFEWANISKTYPKEIKDYIQLCKSCHVRWDVWNQEPVL